MTLVKEYNTIDEAVQAANSLHGRGVAENEVFVLAHDDGVTNTVANYSEAEKIGVDETGMGTAFKNMFRSQGDELRSKMKEIGLSPTEADSYERTLDKGKILLICKDDNQSSFL
ncbi:general stress protein [Sporosarcina globispora]|uniref:General stress protein n=1 Tax=Sporosarcina globispora TaxID=1459 RepID=A0A0M0G6J1_SPOGL|nr:general stress protein [Sporosarcina globispora]KON85500.1 general stress protein [Sporosarcina globispora]